MNMFQIQWLNSTLYSVCQPRCRHRYILNHSERRLRIACSNFGCFDTVHFLFRCSRFSIRYRIFSSFIVCFYSISYTCLFYIWIVLCIFLPLICRCPSFWNVSSLPCPLTGQSSCVFISIYIYIYMMEVYT